MSPYHPELTRHLRRRNTTSPRNPPTYPPPRTTTIPCDRTTTLPLDFKEDDVESVYISKNPLTTDSTDSASSRLSLQLIRLKKLLISVPSSPRQADIHIPAPISSPSTSQLVLDDFAIVFSYTKALELRSLIVFVASLVCQNIPAVANLPFLTDFLQEMLSSLPVEKLVGGFKSLLTFIDDVVPLSTINTVGEIVAAVQGAPVAGRVRSSVFGEWWYDLVGGIFRIPKKILAEWEVGMWEGRGLVGIKMRLTVLKWERVRYICVNGSLKDGSSRVGERIEERNKIEGPRGQGDGARE
ncbi:hypothetical protein BJ508DRAFT_324878 [Ascobolus immersus RN42]|uniref:Uncharacterized protein n=1 Tax=Ascobolus immersus RN42 TaxID=1160509 RepID=A0A3N4IE87_ASCIM|nr:hypothetical protein BJ508DRAFT_324878 [Ascobolus immersus RN42]